MARVDLPPHYSDFREGWRQERFMAVLLSRAQAFSAERDRRRRRREATIAAVAAFVGYWMATK